MNNKELKEYVFDQKRRGRSENQIARSLGMSLAHYISMFGNSKPVETGKEIDIPKVITEDIAPVVKESKEEVSE